MILVRFTKIQLPLYDKVALILVCMIVEDCWDAGNIMSRTKSTENVNVQVAEQVAEQVLNQVENAVVEQETSGNPYFGLDYDATIKALVANGGKRHKDVRVKNVNVTDKDVYTMVSFTTNKALPAYVAEDDEFVLGTSNVIYSSLFAIAGAMREDEELAWMTNALLDNANAVQLILSGATLDVIQVEYAAGESIYNPFTTKEDSEATEYDHDVIINYIVGITLSRVGEKFADKLADKLLGDI